MEQRPTDRPWVAPKRTAKYTFGDVLEATDFIGVVDSIYADYWAALDCFVIQPGWFEQLESPPSTKDQVFYGLNALDGESGSIVVGEDAVQKRP